MYALKGYSCAMCSGEILIPEKGERENRAVGIPVSEEKAVWFCSVTCMLKHPLALESINREREEELNIIADGARRVR